MILFLFLYIFFWIAYYYFEGRNDASTILWRDEVRSKSLTEAQINKEEVYSKQWHMYDTLEKIITHFAITFIVFFIGGTFLLYVALLLFSFSIRFILHDYFINKYTGKSVDYIGVTDWYDMFARKLESNGISQWVIKFIALAITIFLVILFL